MISTHTPLAGRDSRRVNAIVRAQKFLLTRPSRGVTQSRRPCLFGLLFLLTRPSRGVTLFYLRKASSNGFLLTRPSRGVTLPRTGIQLRQQFLLTRPSRGVTDSPHRAHGLPKFLLTRPSRGVTIRISQSDPVQRISTHTPLAGRDHFRNVSSLRMTHFYSHAPRGA